MTEFKEEYFNRQYSGDISMSDIPWVTGAVGEDLLRQIRGEVFQLNSSVLELGCGIGVETHYLDRQGMEVTGIDRNRDAIELARMLGEFYKSDAVLRREDVMSTSIEDQFEITMDRFLFHHIPPEERDSYANKVESLTQSGGYFYLRSFSDEMPPSRSGDGPYRITSDDILDTFSEFFSVEHLYRYDGLPLPHDDKQQRYWSFLATRRK